VSEIVWRLDEAQAESMCAFLADTLEVLEGDDEDATYAEVSAWFTELSTLLSQHREYEASRQPPLP
jgi:hypothetical protein